MTKQEKTEKNKDRLKQSALWIASDGTAFEDSQAGKDSAARYARKRGLTVDHFPQLKDAPKGKKASKKEPKKD